MYKIYINDTKLVLLPSNKILKPAQEENEHLVVRYNGSVNHLHNFIDMCEKTSRYHSITIHSLEVEKLISDFEGIFKIVEAAGGVVINEKNEILFIHRKGSWDLPKGKLESNETRREAAKREVMEETGVANIQVSNKLFITKHTFKNNSEKRCIKVSHWYLMFGKKQKLTPQKEEDIQRTKWMTLEKFYSKERKVYGNIHDVLDKIKTAKK